MLQHPNILPIYDAAKKRPLLHRHGARARSAHPCGLLRPDNLLRIDDVVELVYKAARAALRAQRGSSTAHQTKQYHADARERLRIIDFASPWWPTPTSRASKESPAARRTCRPNRCSRSNSRTARICTRWCVMYELLTGTRPSGRQPAKAAASNRIRHASADPHAASGNPEELENVAAMALQKDPRSATRRIGFRRRIDPRAPKAARTVQPNRPAEQFGLLRKLKFFHEFSHSEIWEVLRASSWQDYATGRDRERGEMTIASTSSCRDASPSSAWQGSRFLESGECFGETATCGRETHGHHQGRR